MSNCPQHSNSIHLIKGILCVNKLKSLIFLGRVRVPNILNPAYFPIDSLLRYCTDMVILAFMGSLRYRDFQNALSKNSAPGFPNAHRT